MSHQYDKCITLQYIHTPQATQCHSVQTNTRVCAATVNPNLRSQTDCQSSWGLEAQFKVLLLDLLECWSLGEKNGHWRFVIGGIERNKTFQLSGTRTFFYWVHRFITSCKKKNCYSFNILNGNRKHVFNSSSWYWIRTEKINVNTQRNAWKEKSKQKKRNQTLQSSNQNKRYTFSWFGFLRIATINFF